MFSNNKSYFETIEEFQSIQQLLRKMHEHRDALQSDAKKDGVGSLSDMKFQIFDQALVLMDNMVRDFSRKSQTNYPRDKDLIEKDKRQLLLELASVINGVFSDSSYHDILHRKRNHWGDTRRYAGLTAFVAVPIAIVLTLPSMVVGVPICAAVGAPAALYLGAVGQAVTITHTNSTILVVGMARELNRAYTLLSENMTDEAKQTELNLIRDSITKQSQSQDVLHEWDKFPFTSNLN